MMPRSWRETSRLEGLDVLAVRPTLDALAEFERLDAIAPLDEEGRPAWSFEGEPLTARERRWLELYCRLEICKQPAKARGRRR